MDGGGEGVKGGDKHIHTQYIHTYIHTYTHPPTHTPQQHPNTPTETENPDRPTCASCTRLKRMPRHLTAMDCTSLLWSSSCFSTAWQMRRSCRSVWPESVGEGKGVSQPHCSACSCCY